MSLIDLTTGIFPTSSICRYCWVSEYHTHYSPSRSLHDLTNKHLSGRPNSSLYFIGLQGDDLIYLDPHFSRSAVETKALQEYTAAVSSSVIVFVDDLPHAYWQTVIRISPHTIVVYPARYTSHIWIRPCCLDSIAAPKMISTTSAILSLMCDFVPLYCECIHLPDEILTLFYSIRSTKRTSEHHCLLWMKKLQNTMKMYAARRTLVSLVARNIIANMTMSCTISYQSNLSELAFLYQCPVFLHSPICHTKLR